MVAEGFFLGLSNSLACMGSCGPLLLPFLMAEGRGVRSNMVMTGLFLAGRMAGYVLFAILVWAVSRTIFSQVGHKNIIMGICYVAVSLVLMVYGFGSRNAGACQDGCPGSRQVKIAGFGSRLLPVSTGFITGLSVCPPFMMATAGAASQNSLTGTLLFFLFFFTGTSLLLVLSSFVGIFGKFPMVQWTGKLASGLMGSYYVYSGIMLIIGGIYQV